MILMSRLMLAPDYARFVIRDGSKLAIFYSRFTNNANGHIRRICIGRLIFVSIR